jgi:carboxypeptidase Taq
LFLAFAQAFLIKLKSQISRKGFESMLSFAPFYQEYLDKLAAYTLVSSIVYTDQSTIAPKKGLPYSNKMMSILAKESFKISNDPETIAKIKEYAKTLEEGSLEKKEVDLRLEELAATENVPADVYASFVKARADSEMIWHEAKEKNDYELFKPYLKDVMDKTLEMMKYSPKYTGDNAYDVMLDQYEKGMSQEFFDAFFDEIKKELVPFIAKLHEEGTDIDDSFLETPVDIATQEKFNLAILDDLKMDPGRVYLSTTEHPFTDFISHNDVRITTHYYPNRFLSAVLSTVHEYGHALYSLQTNEEFDGTMLKNAVGSAAHESQSRLLENYIGRSKAFWQANYDLLCEQVPAFKAVSIDELHAMINTTHNGLVRTEADELTYPLHILIRYELEKEIANGTVDYDTLPQAWADKYEQYLGIRPTSMSNGVLQDMHWSAGYLGYFPTYALGSAIAAQLFNKMSQDLNVDELLLNHQFDVIAKWLLENVHQYGASKGMLEIVEEVCGEPFNVKYYIDYLKDKYSKLYQLDK